MGYFEVEQLVLLGSLAFQVGFRIWGSRFWLSVQTPGTPQHLELWIPSGFKYKKQDLLCYFGPTVQGSFHKWSPYCMIHPIIWVHIRCP